MPSLIDALTEDAQALVRTVAEGYIAAGGQWPVWQYVWMGLHDRGIDAADVLFRLPTWQHHYRPVALPLGGSLPELAEPVALTMHGVVHAGGLVATRLVPPVLASLRLAAEAQKSVAPDPRQVVPVEVAGDRFTEQVNMEAGSAMSSGQLYEALKREPVSWSGLRETGATWSWDLTRAPLHRFGAVATGEDYLVLLEEVVGIPAAPPTAVVLSPAALPEALDHLDLAWRITTSRKLIKLPRAILVARLTQPAINAEEFEARCSALSDIFASFEVPEIPHATGKGTLRRWADALEGILAEDAAPALEAVEVLRRVVSVRNSQQHSGSAARYERDRRSLGLHQFGSDWFGAWEHLRTLCVQALDTIRETLVSRLDREGSSSE